jgi:hypothetical protein
MIRRTALAPIVAFALSLSAVALAADVPAIPAPPASAPPPAQFPSDGANGGQTVTPPAPPSTPPAAPPSDANTPPSAPPLGAGNLPPIPPAAGGTDSAMPPTGDTSVSHDKDEYNRPKIDWYKDIYNQIYQSYYYFGEVEKWAYHTYYDTYHADYWNYKEVYEMYVYASYMRYYFQEYFWTYFEYDNVHGYVVPRYYDFDYEGKHFHSYAWRGDFDYNYYYYVRPMYHEYLKHAGKYYSKHHHDNDYNHDYGYGRYSDHGGHAKSHYYSYTNCLYGSMGTDTQAPSDDQAPSLEAAAGF